jgi:hypothetical protein
MLSWFAGCIHWVSGSGLKENLREFCIPSSRPQWQYSEKPIFKCHQTCSPRKPASARLVVFGSGPEASAHNIFPALRNSSARLFVEGKQLLRHRSMLEKKKKDNPMFSARRVRGEACYVVEATWPNGHKRQLVGWFTSERSVADRVRWLSTRLEEDKTNFCRFTPRIDR